MSSALDLCSAAWGEHEGYVCLSIRDPKKPKGQNWKDLIFKWPDDKPRVEAALKKAETSTKDIYFAPAVFGIPTRANDAVLKSDVLYADLDDVAPDSIPKHLKPTAIWESSPGRYQAMWQLDKLLSPKLHAEINQRLTYALGADKGGWALSKVLRLPGTHNHKYPDRPEVKLLYLNGHVTKVADLRNDLPEVVSTPDGVTELPDPFEVMKGVKLNAKTKQLLVGKPTGSTDRSAVLWQLECLLAEQGLDAPAIAAVVQQTAWNKFKGRNNEVDRLLTEAHKAVAHAGVSEQAKEEEASPFEVLDDEDNAVGPQNWDEFDKEHQPITWLVAEIWGESEVGFISGHPKSYKSWLALDLAVSVATGTRFLGGFQARKHNVLLIQEEDPKPILQDRLVKIGAAKGLVHVSVVDDTHINYKYELPDNLFIISNQGFQVEEEWMKMLEQWVIERDIKLVILDPLMMTAGAGFDEFKAFEFMQKVLKPLKRLRARTGAAVVVVHHHTKGGEASGARAMYGSVALWAWEEAALHLEVSGVGKVTAERFSKHSMLPPLLVDIGDVKEVWHPGLSTNAPTDLYDVLSTMEAGATIDELANFTGLGKDVLGRELRALLKAGKVTKEQGPSSGVGRPKAVWRRKGIT